MLHCHLSAFHLSMVRVAELSTAESKSLLLSFYASWLMRCELMYVPTALLFSCMNFVLSILFCTYSTIQLCSSNLTRFWLPLIAFFWSGSHIHSPIFLNLNSAIIFILSMFRLFSFSLIIGRTCTLNKMNAKLVLVYILIYFSFVSVFLF